MTEVQPAVPSRWGMGDAAVGVVASLFLSIVGVLVIAGVGGYESTDDFPIWVQTIAQVPLWFGLLLGVRLAVRKGASVRDDLGLQLRRIDLAVGAVAGLVLQLVVSLVVVPVYELLGIDTDQVGDAAQNLADKAVTGPDVVFLVLIVVLCAPIVEEVFYRGLLLQSIDRRFGTALAVVGSSIVFGAIHFQPYDLLPLSLAGLAFALLRVRRDRLGPAIAAHMSFNLTAVIALLAS